MSSIVVLSGSPSAASKTAALAAHVARRLGREPSFEVTTLNVRDLPAEDLLHARMAAPGLQQALAAVAAADGVVVATPIYKAAYTGVLKAFLDILPQFGLAGKTVLPLATGGTLAHVLAIDFALRPVLHSLGAHHVLPGLFVLEKGLTLGEDGTLAVSDEWAPRLEEIVRPFIDSLRRARLSLEPGSGSGALGAPT